MPKVSFFAALPVGTESIAELVDIELIEAVDIFSVKEKINHELPHGIDVILVKEISPIKKRRRISESQFLITFKGPKIKEKDLRGFLESDHFSVVKTNKKGDHEIDARALVSSISLVSPNKLQLTLMQTEGPGLKPTEIVKGIFSLTDADLLNMDVLKTGQVLA